MASQVAQDSFSRYFEPCSGDEELATSSFFDFYTDEFAAQDVESHPTMEVIVMRSAQFISEIIHYDDPSVLQAIQSFVSFFELDAETFLLALITFHRYIKYNINNLDIQELSQVFTLFVNCIVLAQKALDDTPIYQGQIAQSLELDLSDMVREQLEIFKAIGYNMFYTEEDVQELDSVFPIEGLLQLSYSSAKPVVVDEEPSTEAQFEEFPSRNFSVPQQEFPITPVSGHPQPSSPTASLESSSTFTISSGDDSDLGNFSDGKWTNSPDARSIDDVSSLIDSGPIYIRT